MTKNDKNYRKKRLTAIVFLLLLFGSASIPLLDEISKEMPIRQQSTVIFSQDIDLENKVVGGPVGDPAVENVNTSEIFETIQDAIDDADTINGNILEINSSTYIENIIVTKSLKIRGIGTGADQPLVDGSGGNGCVIAVNNVTIENINISNSSKGILSNYSGLTVLNSTFWLDDQGIDCNYTKTCLTNSDYQIYDNTIQNNRFLINTVNDLDGAVGVTLSLHYQNHSGMVSIGDFTITNNSFFLNDSHAFAVSYTDNSIRWLKEGAISIGSFIFSENTIYKNNNGNNGVYFIGALSYLTNVSITVDDIVVSSNNVIDQSYAAFYVEQYKAEYWSGTTTGVFGEISVTNNNISSSNSCDGFQISQSNVYGFSDDASLIMGDCHIEGNIIVVSDGYAIVFYMDDVGYQLQDSTSVVVGQISISSNDLTTGNGLLIEFYECGYMLTQEAYCSLGTLQITDNIIDSTETGVYIQQFSYLGLDLSEDTKFSMGDIHIDNNQIESGMQGVYFSQLLLGENLSGSTDCTYGDLTMNDNDVTSDGDGIVLTSSDSAFRLGNWMSESSNVSMHGIEISKNTIRDSVSGVFIGPCLFGGENENLDLNSFKISNNSISFCSIGLNIKNFSISDWTQPTINNNTVDNCSIGINLSSSYNNLIYNNFFDNTQNARDDTENVWNIAKITGHNILGGSYLGGNYWSDYAGIDGDNDTLGDTLLPYNSLEDITTGGDLRPLTLVTGDISLTAPTDFTATVVGTTQINLSWTKGINAINTRVMRKIVGYPNSISDGSLVYNDTGVSCSSSDLSPGVKYYFRAWSWNNTTGLWSSTNASVSNTTWIVPQSPSDFSVVTIGTDEISLSWVKGAYATHTRIQRDIGSYPIDINDGNNVYNGTSNIRLDTGLNEDTQYYYRAWSWNSTSRLWSSTNVSDNALTWGIPLEPTSFKSETVGINAIDLFWTKGTHAEYTRVMQKTGGYPTSISDGILLYNGTGTSCSNSSLSAGIRYYFRAWSWNGTSKLWSLTNASNNNITWNTPLAPTSFTATTIGSNRINLTWVKGSYSEYTRIQRKTTVYPESIIDGTPVYNGTGSIFSDTGLSVNTTYCYRAWSWNDTSKLWSTTNASIFNSTWTGPLAPQSISATTISTNRIDLSWTKGFRATHTKVMQKTGGYPLSISDGSLVYNGTGSSCSNSSLTPGMRYYFRAWSWNSSSELWSLTNATGNNMTWIIPLAPTAFTSTAINIDEINLTWSKGTYATHTQIQRSIGGYPEDINDGVTVYNGTSNIFSDTSLSQDTRYYYRAWSWNATSHLPSSTNTSTNATTFSLPLPPTSLTAITVAIDQINLTWTKGIHAVYTIVIQKTTNYPISISDGDIVYNGTGNVSSSSGLILGTRYYFRAWSWNDSSGIWSEANSSSYNITAPFAPTSFTPSVISSGQINLVWNKGTYANYTLVQRKTGSYPQNISDGVTIYNGTNSSVSVTGLSSGTLYYFRAWSWNSTLNVWSITYASAQATTQSGGGSGEETPPPAEGEAPTAEAGGPYSGYVNQTITFNAGLSSDDVQIVGYRWDWTNDGTWDTNWLVLSKTTHVYTTPGNYTVNLQVQDAEDLRDNDTTIVVVITGNSQQQAPVADAAGPYHGLTYQNIQFNGSRSYAMNTNIVNYTWVFGDGTYGYGVLPIHSYESAGTFTVILTVTDSNTLQAIDTTLATIILDANKNNISDVIDEAIGSDITSDDLRTVTIDGVLYYLVDTNHDGKSDAFYNPITNKKTILGMQDDKQLIDLDGDGKWDYVYDPALGLISAYVEVVTPLNTPWLSITICVVIFVVILLIVWLYKTGRV
jgi:parallel beta-helix repeat protein